MMLSFDLKPIKFHRYRSYVRDRILETDFDEKTDSIRKYLIEFFNHEGIKCRDDNKIVFECELAGTTICYGFYDLKFSIGLSYYDESEPK